MAIDATPDNLRQITSSVYDFRFGCRGLDRAAGKSHSQRQKEQSASTEDDLSHPEILARMGLEIQFAGYSMSFAKAEVNRRTMCVRISQNRYRV